MDNPPLTAQELKNFAQELKNSPLFAMSLGGKELFHSNFWAWLIEKDPKFAEVFFNIKTVNLTVNREQNHHDLTILNGNEIYIIENKIKALPSEEQLNKYKNDILLYFIKRYKNKKLDFYKKAIQNLSAFFSKDEIESFKNANYKHNTKNIFEILDSEDILVKKSHFGLLTGLTENGPEYIKSIGWNYLSYASISERIQNILENSKLDDFEKELVTKYCKDISTLSEMFASLLEESKDTYTFDNAANLEAIRFDDVFKKHKMSIFAQTLDLVKYSFLDEVKVDYSNKNANLTIRFSEKKDDLKYSVGIQLEGYQFRLFAEAPGLVNNTSSENSAVFGKFVKAGLFVKQQGEAFFNGETRCGTANPCNKYKPNFVYQYFNIQKGITYDKLRHMIYDVCDKLQTIIKEYGIVKFCTK